MPRIVREELWVKVKLPAVYAVTTNSKTNKYGQLVMGRGAAHQATLRIPGIAKECAHKIAGRSSYYWVVVREPTAEKAGFGIFQVKYHWANDANLALIERSVEKLRNWCALYPAIRVRMNYPGIGNGRLDRDDVKPLLEPLPSQVTVCFR